MMIITIIQKKSNHITNNISNQKQSINLRINIAISNDSDIHEDGLDTNSQKDLRIKSTKNYFQLFSWLTYNQSLPDERHPKTFDR
jgi:hypothetical protein